MIAAILAIAVFLALAHLMVRWAAADYRTQHRLTMRSSVGLWLLYLFHADTVATAAYAGALQVSAVPTALAWALGATVGVIGLVLFVASGAALGRALDGEQSRLVISGPYRLLRHPQNVGWALVLLGIAVASRSVLALGLVGLFAAFVQRYMRVEEQHLAEQFGAAWQRYRDRTPALAAWRRTGPARSTP